MLAIIDDIFIGFVGDHDQVTVDGKTRDCFDFRPSAHDPRRIYGCVEIDGAGLFGCIASQRFAESIGASFAGRYEHEPALTVSDEILDRRPVGGKDQYVVAGIDYGLKGAEQPLHAAVNDEDTLFASRNSITISQLVSNCAPQF